MFFSFSIIHKTELKQIQTSSKFFYNSLTYLQQSVFTLCIQSVMIYSQKVRQLYQSISFIQSAINLTTEAVINLAVELSESSLSSKLSASSDLSALTELPASFKLHVSLKPLALHTSCT